MAKGLKVFYCVEKIVMKKTIMFLSLLIVVVMMAACGGVDFKSVYDTSTKTMLALGDEKAKFDKALGEGVVLDVDAYDWYSYLDGRIAITFEDDIATYISVGGDDERFAFDGFRFDMSIQQLVESGYEVDEEYLGSVFYARYLDNQGQDVAREDAVYRVCAVVQAEKTNSTPAGTITAFSLQKIYQKDKT